LDVIISFAWTTPAVVIGEKTQTRRDWSRKTIVAATKVLQAGASVQAYDKSPRFGGKEFGTIRLTQIVAQEDSQTIPQEAWQAEGFHVLQTLGATTVRAFVRNLQFRHPKTYWDIRKFRLQVRSTFISVTLWHKVYSITWYYDQIHHDKKKRNK
jgi:hypothetical protein